MPSSPICPVMRKSLGMLCLASKYKENHGTKEQYSKQYEVINDEATLDLSSIPFSLHNMHMIKLYSLNS